MRIKANYWVISDKDINEVNCAIANEYLYRLKGHENEKDVNISRLNIEVFLKGNNQTDLRIIEPRTVHDWLFEKSAIFFLTKLSTIFNSICSLFKYMLDNGIIFDEALRIRWRNKLPANLPAHICDTDWAVDVWV